MKPIEVLRKLNESISPDIAEAEYNEVLNEFRSFIESKYNCNGVEELKSQLENVTEEDLNEFFMDKFYDEDDMDKLNAEEDAVRSVYPPVTDESIFEPTPEDIEEMKYWYNDNPADLYAEKEREYDDGDTDWNAEHEADATERMERRYGGSD